MKEDETVQGVYDESSKVSYNISTCLIEDKSESITVCGNRWILKYTVCREAGATEVRVMASFNSRYSFPDKFTLAINVDVADKEITEKFDLVKESDNNFQVDLTKNGFPEVENKDIRVYCEVSMTNVKILHYLATWSQFFDGLFKREKDKKELEIKDVDSGEFETLLEVISPDMTHVINDDTVLYLLKLADRFIMPSLMAMCGTFLMDFKNCSKRLTHIDRLVLSDKYNLAHLQVTCLKRIHKWSAAEFKTFLDVNRNRIKQLSNYTLQNLI